VPWERRGRGRHGSNRSSRRLALGEDVSYRREIFTSVRSFMFGKTSQT
jgi:hypothetical protein